MAGSRAVFMGEGEETPVVGDFGTDAAVRLTVPANCIAREMF
jgi:hypothetical protein